MFTGIVETIGTITEIGQKQNYKALSIMPVIPFMGLSLGESIAVDGCCLTVINLNEKTFIVEASPESIRHTVIGDYKVGTKANLERALQPTSRLGGHFVTGHIDCVGVIDKVKRHGDILEIYMQYSSEYDDYIIPKGSIAVSGISLTVNRVEGNIFSVNLIPHTRNITTIDMLKTGDKVNLEFDIIGKYIAKMLKKEEKDKLTIEKLINSGW
jgi:riboflavin synthase